MNIYVAGRTNDIPRIKRMQAACVMHGHKITYDWTENVNAQSLAGDAGLEVTAEQKREYAVKDLSGVYYSDLVIACCAPGWLGTAIEFGAACAWGRPIWLVGEPEKESVFFELTNVRRVEHDLLAYKMLYEYSERRIERDVSPIVIRHPDHEHPFTDYGHGA